MDEKKLNETGAAQDINAGDKPAAIDKIERAELAVKRMEETEKRLDEKIARLTELEANRLLGGTAGGHIESMKSIEQLRQEKIQREADAIVKAFKK